MTIENFVKETLSVPIKQIHQKACSRFIQKFNIHCKLNDHIKLLKQIFFMEAGNYMHEFSVELFKQLDSGLAVDNLYMINGHF